jgi:hypothetical protein
MKRTRTRIPEDVTRVRNVVTGAMIHLEKEPAMYRNEDKERGEVAVTLSRNPLMLITLYDLSEKFAIALAEAIETDNVDKLSALIIWDIENYLDENGGVDEWLN